MNIWKLCKLHVIGGVLLMVSVMLTGCSSQALSKNFDETEVKEAAVMIVDLINTQDSEGLLDQSVPKLRAVLTEEVLEDVFKAINAGGAFVAIDGLSLRGMMDRSSGEAYAVVTVRAKYEHQTFVFTISFTELMKLAGLYYR